MSNPIIKIPIQSVHYDSAGTPVVHDQPYELEWMRRNYIQNGGFELWGGSNLTWWNDSNMNKVSSGVHGGSYAAQSVDSHSSLETPYIEVNPACSYHLQFWHKAESAGVGMHYTVYAYDESYNQVGVASLVAITSSISWANVQVPILSGTWGSSVKYVKVTFNFETSPLVTIDDVSFTTYNPHMIEEFDDFEPLMSDSMETYTFRSEPLIDSRFYDQDDPSTEIESIGGALRFESDRYPRRSFSVKLRLFTKEAVNQLRRVHAKTRNIPFTYVDHEGISRTVRWNGPFSAAQQGVSTDIYTVTLNLRETTVTDGA